MKRRFWFLVVFIVLVNDDDCVSTDECVSHILVCHQEMVHMHVRAQVVLKLNLITTQVKFEDDSWSNNFFNWWMGKRNFILFLFYWKENETKILTFLVVLIDSVNTDECLHHFLMHLLLLIVTIKIDNFQKL